MELVSGAGHAERADGGQVDLFQDQRGRGKWILLLDDENESLSPADDTKGRPGGTVVTGHDNEGGGENKTLALGDGVSIRVTTVIVFSIIGHVLRMRLKSVLEVKRSRRRFEFVID